MSSDAALESLSVRLSRYLQESAGCDCFRLYACREFPSRIQLMIASPPAVGADNESIVLDQKSLLALGASSAGGTGGTVPRGLAPENDERWASQLRALFRAESVLFFHAGDLPAAYLALAGLGPERYRVLLEDSRLRSMGLELAAAAAVRSLQSQLDRAREPEILCSIGEGLGHDISGLLTPARLLATLAQGAAPTGSKVSECAKVAHASLEQIDEIILSARGLSQGIGFSRAPVNIKRLLEEELALLGPCAEEKQVTLELALAEGAWVLGDQVLLHRLLKNLIQNAIRASPDGDRVQINIGSVPPSGSAPPRCLIRLANGDASRVFDSDVEGAFPPNPLLPLADHAGFGLRICRRIVQLHEGVLRLVREGEKSMVVFLELPAPAGTSSPPP